MGIEAIQSMDLTELRELAANEHMSEWFDEVFYPNVDELAFSLAGLDALPGIDDEAFAEAVSTHYGDAASLVGASIDVLAEMGAHVIEPALKARAETEDEETDGLRQFRVLMGLIITYLQDTENLFATWAAALTDPLVDYPEGFEYPEEG